MLMLQQQLDLYSESVKERDRVRDAHRTIEAALAATQTELTEKVLRWGSVTIVVVITCEICLCV